MSVLDYEIQAALAGKSTDEIVNVMFPGMSRDAEVRNSYGNYLKANRPEQRHLAAVKAAQDFRAGRMTMATVTPEKTAPLWSVMAAEVVDAYDEVQLPLQDLAWEVHPELLPQRPGQQPRVNVYVNHGRHTTQKNATAFGNKASGLATMVEVVTNGFTTETEVSEVELRNYGSLKRQLGAMINSHREALGAELGAVVRELAPASCENFVAASPDVVGRLVTQNGTLQGADALGPEVVAEQIYPLFPGGVDMLVLDVTAYAHLLARTRTDFDPVDGAWGIRKFRKFFPFPGMEKVGMKAYGLALMKNAICWAACQPFVDEGMGQTHWESLGEVDGVPLWLNVWYDHSSRVYKLSVNSQVGFAVANGRGVYLLSGPTA